MKYFYLITSMLISLLITGNLAADNKGNASGNVGEKSFNVSITCNIPLGEKALPAFFSFSSGKFDEKNEDTKVSGQSLSDGNLLFSIIANDFEKSIILSNFRVDNGTLNTSGAISGNKKHPSFHYDILIKCN